MLPCPNHHVALHALRPLRTDWRVSVRGTSSLGERNLYLSVSDALPLTETQTPLSPRHRGSLRGDTERPSPRLDGPFGTPREAQSGSVESITQFHNYTILRPCLMNRRKYPIAPPTTPCRTVDDTLSSRCRYPIVSRTMPYYRRVGQPIPDATIPYSQPIPRRDSWKRWPCPCNSQRRYGIISMFC